MNQNFPIMKQLAPLLFVRKTITNRALKPPSYFRRKCDINDKMYFFTDYRTEFMTKIAEAIVVKTAEWDIKEIPLTIEEAKKKESPKKDIDWVKFSWIDGFDLYQEFVNYFKNHSLKISLFKMFEFVENKKIIK